MVSFRLAGVVAGIMMAGGTLLAQAPQHPPMIPVRVDVTLSRYQGEKKISSMPFVLAVAANGQRMQVRDGINLYLGATTETKTGPNGGPTTSTTSGNYTPIGTQIDCGVGSVDDGRFLVTVSVNDSEIYEDAQHPAASASVGPANLAVRSFFLSNALPMRDGQTIDFSSAVDKITGEVYKVSVTLTVVK
jgi:hypothetical protein